MRSVKLSTVLIVLVVSGGMALMGGCDSQMKDLELRNRTQQEEIAKLQSQLQTAQMQLDQLKRRLAAAEQTGGVEVDALRQKVAALEEDLIKKKELIESMQERLLGFSPLPVELDSALADLARQYEMIEYDPNRGLVKFKSDLLFDKGSDDVSSAASEVVRALCGILNSEAAREFHIIVAGHTDDMPIRRPQTQVEHPTNRHLSSHRAISVVVVLESCGVASERLSTRGFGQYRPVAQNAPNKGGNPKNRRVEIYIVPKGV
jgi:chemotaxis protein MotB